MRRAGLATVLTAAVVLAAFAMGTSSGAVVATRLATKPRASRVLRHTQPRIGFALPGGTIVTGQSFEVEAATVPRDAHEILVLERRGARRWRSLAVAVTARGGLATFSVRPQPPGTLKLRVVERATGTRPGVTSGAASLTIEPVYGSGGLAEGASGPAVLALQQRLTQLGYWVGTPNGQFGDATQQAVYAVQKAAGLPRTGVVSTKTAQAVLNGVLPTPRSTTGSLVEVDLEDDLVMWVHNGVVQHVLNTSTGGGYTYTEDGASLQAITPRGRFTIQRAVNGLVVDTLGALWRPRFFYEGYAIHGDGFVPPYPVSHGCVRVSNEAIDWIWSENLLPIGEPVWLY